MNYSPPSLGTALLCGAVGVFFIFGGVKAVIKREAEGGRRHSSHHIIVRGKNAITMGIGLILFGLYWVTLGVLDLLKLRQS